MVSPQMRSSGPDRAAAAPCLPASIAAGGAARARTPACDPRPHDATQRSHRGLPALIRSALAGPLGEEVRPSVVAGAGGKNIPILGASCRGKDWQRQESEHMPMTPAKVAHAAKAAFARPDQPSPSSAPQALLLGHGSGICGVPGHAPRGRRGQGPPQARMHYRISEHGGSGIKASAQGAPATAGRRRPIVVLAALLLAACDHYQGSEHRRLGNATAVGLSDPELRHPMRVAPRRETLDIEVPPNADGLSPNQHIEVVRFLERQPHEAKRRLVVFVPQGGARPASIARFLQDIQRHLADADTNYRIIKMTTWQRGPDAAPSIRLAYERPFGIAPTCGDGNEDAARNAQRLADRTWGCASAHSLAVPIDTTGDPRLPQPEDPRSSDHRAQSWSTYLGSVAQAGGGEAAPAASRSKGAGMTGQ